MSRERRTILVTVTAHGMIDADMDTVELDRLAQLVADRAADELASHIVAISASAEWELGDA